MVERAEAVVLRRSRAIGLVQRFSLGFRGPLCLVAGFTGAPRPAPLRPAPSHQLPCPAPSSALGRHLALPHPA